VALRDSLDLAAPLAKLLHSCSRGPAARGVQCVYHKWSGDGPGPCAAPTRRLLRRCLRRELVDLADLLVENGRGRVAA
jgi:hypothetical protein